MANLTVTIDEELLKRARVRAIEQGTSVNAIVRAHLEAFADADRLGQVGRRLVELSEASSSGSGPRGRSWSRDDLHAR